MNLFYSDALLRAWKTRAKNCLSGVCALLLMGLLACIFLCTRVKTGNADVLLFAVIAISTVTGWAAMLLMFFRYAPARAQCGHIAGVMVGDKQEYTGEIHVSEEKIHIPKSIDIHKVTLRNGEETHSFNIDAVLFDHLPQNGVQVRILAARKFIAACEVIA